MVDPKDDPPGSNPPSNPERDGEKDAAGDGIAPRRERKGRPVVRIVAISHCLTEIPPVLRPAFAPRFDRCLMCERPFAADQRFYVERALRRGEPLFEYALCLVCLGTVQAEWISRESHAALSAHWEARVDWKRHAQAADPDGAHWKPRLSHCLITGLPMEECEEFQVFGLCEGDKLVVGELPCFLSGAAIEEMLPLLSRTTRDNSGRFIRDYLGAPPELRLAPVLL